MKIRTAFLNRSFASLRLPHQLQEHPLYPNSFFSVIFHLLLYLKKKAISRFQLVHKHHKKSLSLDVVKCAADSYLMTTTTT